MGLQESITSILFFQKLFLLCSWQQPRDTHCPLFYFLKMKHITPKFLKQLLIGDKSKQQYKMVTNLRSFQNSAPD